MAYFSPSIHKLIAHMLTCGGNIVSFQYLKMYIFESSCLAALMTLRRSLAIYEDDNIKRTQ